MTQRVSSPSLVGSFSRSQVSSAVASAADFVVLFGLVEVLHVWYVAATAIGALVGAISNFVMNRHWSFEATHARWYRQAFRYALISLISMILNSGGVWAVTERFQIHYSISVFVVSALVGIFFNFPMHRYFVFK